jgi:uncharacterized protein
MKLDLDRQPQGRSELEIVGRLALGMGEGRPDEVEVSGTLTVQNITSRILVSGSLQAEGAAVCDRCLGDFPLQWPVPVDLMVLRDVASDEDEGETLLILQRDGEVDLQEPLREFCVLAFPQMAVCRDDCQGLCPSCGADLNAAPCDCEKEDFDPRWEGLP